MVHAKTETTNKIGAFKDEGERLENEMWAEMKARNLKAIEKKIAPDFQSVHMDGQRNREAELELIKNLHVGKYTISNLKSTHQGDTIVVTYHISVEEMIDNRPLTHKSTPRLSVWKKNRQNEWQWIAHANLISLGKH